MGEYKLVSIITKEMRNKDGVVLQKAGLAVRVPRRLAQIQVDLGHASFTSKGKHRQLIKLDSKQKRRDEILAAKKRAAENRSKTKVKGHRRNPDHIAGNLLG